MFFRLEGSVDNKVIGNVNSQYQDANYGGDINSPLYLGNVFLRDVDLDKIIVPYPIINKGAKITDLVWGTCYGDSLRLLIN